MLGGTTAFVARAGTLLLLCAVTSLAFAGAPLPEGRKIVTLVGAGGERVAIGHVAFTPDGDGASFKVALDEELFSDEFLSMRPFQCLSGEKEMWCHLEYPYDLESRISADDLTDLEYSLLFLFKPPKDYGINPYNGLYFKLELGKDGAITGKVHDVDLDPLGVPPGDLSTRVIAPEDLSESDPETHRFSRIEIR